MNLHNINQNNLPLLRDYLQRRYGWRWEIQNQTLRFQTSAHAEWVVMPEDELRHYAAEANVWANTGRPTNA